MTGQEPQACAVELFVGDPGFLAEADGPAFEAKLSAGSIAVRDGSIYFTGHNRIRKLDPQGMVTTIAGSGAAGWAGDGGPALQAQLNLPSSLAFGPDGALYVVDDLRRRIRRILPNGNIETVYTTSVLDDPRGPSALGYIDSLSFGSDGSLYFLDRTDLAEFRWLGVLRLKPHGSLELVAGGGSVPRPGVHALDFQLGPVSSLVVLSNDDLVIASDRRIVIVGDDRIVKLLVGGGDESASSGVTNPLAIGLTSPAVYAETAVGDLLFGETNGFYILKGGLVERLYSGVSYAAPSNGSIFVTRQGQIWRLDPGSSAQLIAGVDPTSQYGPGHSWMQTRVAAPDRLVGDSLGNLYYVEAIDPSVVFGTFDRIRVYRATPGGNVDIVAGGGQTPLADGVAAVDLNLTGISDLAVDAQDRLYLGVAGPGNFDNAILRVEPTGTITILARPEPNFGGGNTAPDIAVGTDGTVYFTFQNGIMQVTTEGVVGPAPFAPFTTASRMEIDSSGRLVVANGNLSKPSILLFPNVTAAPSQPFQGPSRDAFTAANGALFVLGSSYEPFVSSIVRVSPDGAKTDLFPYDLGFSFVNGNVDINSAIPGVNGMGINPQGDLFVASATIDSIFVIRNADECILDRPNPVAIVNSSSFAPAGYTPGELVSVFGSQLGPESIAYGAPGQASDGTWQTDVGGLQAFVNGQPAPIIFARSDQAAFVMPNDLGRMVHVYFKLNGIASSRTYFEVADASPGLFTADASGGGQAAALNQDSSVNSPSNPAAAGSVIVLYLTGAGRTDPPSQTGSLNAAPLPALTQPVEVSIKGKQAVVEFAGPAPGLISGVVQVNARIPPDTPSGAVRVDVNIGGISSPLSRSGEPVTISIQ